MILTVIIFIKVYFLVLSRASYFSSILNSGYLIIFNNKNMKRYISLGAALMMGTVLSKRQVHHEEPSITKIENTGKKHISNHVTKKQPSADSSSLEQYRVDLEKFAMSRYQVQYN
jgi:hypothetical protein